MTVKNLRYFRFVSVFVESIHAQAWTKQLWVNELIAGIAVGVMTVPVAMAFAIACGAPPQHGLYTAVIAGILAALFGGSKLSISGPTASMVVILQPISIQLGLSGMLMTTLLAGIILVLMALTRIGRLIEFIPEPVSLGFTSGIALLIVMLQIKDLFGLPIEQLPTQFLPELEMIIRHFPQAKWQEALIGISTLLTLIFWPKDRWRFPPVFPAALVGMFLVIVLDYASIHVDTVGSRFYYLAADGTVANGIPSGLPSWIWPWQAYDFRGLQFSWSVSHLKIVIAAAFSLSVLIAIESSICAVILDDMLGDKHRPNEELFGQGLGNIISPFFGGIAASASILRSTTNLNAGGRTPLAAIFGALFVLLTLALLGPLLVYLPMASVAAILMMVAWRVADVDKIKTLLFRTKLSYSVVYIVCAMLIIFFDI